MKIHANMSEVDFIETIDGPFYFDTEGEYKEVTKIACSLSDNATLMVDYELASESCKASIELGLELLQIMQEKRPQPIILGAIPVIQSLLLGEPPQPEILSRVVVLCKKHPSPWNGLNIIECADSELVEACKAIRKHVKLKDSIEEV